MAKALFNITIAWVLAALLTSGATYAGGNNLLRNPADPSTHLEQKWPDAILPVQWFLSTDGLPASGIPNTALQAELQQSFDTWEQLPTSRLAYTYGGEINQRSAGVDGRNLITFTDPDFVFPPAVLAVALVSSFPQDVTITDANNDIDGDGTPDIPNGFYPAGSIYDADIVFNSSNTLDISGDSGSLDIQAIALHEIGHSFGLAHSLVNGAVMYPFLSSDIGAARIPHSDDVAYASDFYPEEPAYSTSHGGVSGKITRGQDGVGVLGAHVYAVNPETGQKVVGSYSLEQGEYRIPGLVPGNYYIGLEPLDGDPDAADPERINEVIASTFDTFFPEEFYDSNESNIETDPFNVLPVTVSPGSDVQAVDLVTNTVEIPGASRVLKAGMNLFAYPVSTPAGMMSGDLLAALGDSTEINSIDRYNTANGRFERTVWSNNMASGDNFPIERGVGYLVHMKMKKTVTFNGSQDCQPLNLASGYNLIGVPCPPAGYSAFDFLKSLGNESEVFDVQRYNTLTGQYEVARYVDGVPAGTDFPVSNGEAYSVRMLTPKSDVLLSGQGQIFPPLLTGVTPGRGIAGETVLLLGQGFSPDAALNDVRFNGVRAAVTFASATRLTVIVPAQSTSGQINVTVDGKTSNSLDFTVEASVITEVDGVEQELVSGQQVDGSLDTGLEQDRYTFVALKGSVVTIQASSVAPGIPDLMLFLEGPSGAILASDDNGAGGTNARINNYTLPETGIYTVVVTSAPNTGTGPYQLTLDIDTQATAPQISIIEGQFQSAVAGTQLPVPIRILVTGPTGAPIAGVPISIVTSDENIGVATGAYTAATFSVTSNSSGLAVVSISLPAVPGKYVVEIQAPGQTRTSIVVSALSAAPALVEVTGNNQDCGGKGCPVGALLPQPYQLRFLDVSGQPVKGILTRFAVVSGGGDLEAYSPPETGTPRHQVTGADGKVSVTHRLGTALYYKNTTQRVPQQVAAVASIPQQPGPILFGAVARADTAAVIKFLKSNYTQISMGVSRLNAVRLLVTDTYGNPVQGATVSMDATGGLITAPGILNGAFLQDMLTNADGEFVGLVAAPFSVAPTRDEFGGSIGEAYNVTTTVQDVSGQMAPEVLSITIEVDMAPTLVASTQTGGAVPGESQWVGRVLDKPVVMRLRRMQRTDICEVDGNSNDIDAGVWTDENFDPAFIRAVPVPGVGITFAAERDDGEPGNPGPVISVTNAVTNAQGYVQTQLTMSNARGGNDVKATTGGPFQVSFKNDDFCVGGSGAQNIPFTQTEFANMMVDTQTNVFSMNAVSPKITVKLKDNVVQVNGLDVVLAEPVPDPYPGQASQSGIDLSTVNILLDNNSIFDMGAVGSWSAGKYPHFESLILDGGGIGSLDGDSLRVLRPGVLEYIYYPTADEVPPGQHAVQVDIFKDGAGHELQAPEGQTYPVEQSFSLP